MVQLLLGADADANVADGDSRVPVYHAAAGGHSEVVQLLLAAPKLATEAIADAAAAVGAAGHTQLAMVLLNALLQRQQLPAATATLASQSVAAEVIGQWQAAEEAVRELEARWPQTQELIVSIAAAHQQLQTAAGSL
jgi:hypothetical protein